MLKLAIIGYGYWGPNLFRNFNGLQGCDVRYVCDPRAERLENLKRQFPSLNTTSSFNQIINDADIDAVVIATPVHTHFDLAREALKAGKHILVEKPLTIGYAEGLELKKLAEQTGRIIMVDHTFLYTGAVRKIKSIVEEGILGKINYFDSTRINLGLFQPDINVLWDLAPHDISVLNYLLPEKPFSVNATGISHTKNEIENIAYLTVNYQSGFIAHFSCSWTSPVKIRTVLVGGDKKMLLFNDLEPTEKIKIYDSGYKHVTDEDKQKILVDYRAGDVYIPKVDSREALSIMASDFVNAIKTGKRPESDVDTGLEVTRILEAAQRSIKQKGKEILLN